MGGFNIIGIMKIVILFVFCVVFEKKFYDYVCIIENFLKIYFNENIFLI